MPIRSHAFTEPQLDAGLIGDVAESVERARAALEEVNLSKTPELVDVHAALRILVGEKPDVDLIRSLPNPASDLVDILEHLLADYANALKRLSAVAVEPLDAAREYARLMLAAEQAIDTFGRTDGPQRSAAFARLAELRRQEMVL